MRPAPRHFTLHMLDYRQGSSLQQAKWHVGAEFGISTGVRNPRRHKIWRQNLRFVRLLFYKYIRKSSKKFQNNALALVNKNCSINKLKISGRPPCQIVPASSWERTLPLATAKRHRTRCRRKITHWSVHQNKTREVPDVETSLSPTNDHYGKSALNCWSIVCLRPGLDGGRNQ